MILSPSLLSADFGNLEQELKALENAGVTWAHWDVMDGMFVPNITFGPPLIKKVRAASKLFFDVHLMIESPERYLEAFAEAGADLLCVHAEACRHLQRTLTAIRDLGMKSGVALNPATPLNVLDYVLDDTDMVLIMSVNPGFGGQGFIPAVLGKVRETADRIAAAGRDILLQVDGGVTPENTPDLVAAGATVLVSGSAFFAHPPYAERHKAFQVAAASAEK